MPSLGFLALFCSDSVRVLKKVLTMLEVPVLRWGKVYESMEKQPVVHFDTGEVVAQTHQATGAMIKMDLRKAQKARDVLREFTIPQLIDICAKAAELYLNATLPIGNGELNPAEFCRMQSATTGLPEQMCANNMKKNAFVLARMGEVLDSLMRGLPFEILSRGYGKEPGRDVMVSYQANTPVLSAILPSNSPGVHTLWLPAIPMQIGLMLKPGSQEFWTPYRIAEALFQSGLPRETIGLYLGGHDLGGAMISDSPRVMMFGGQATVDQHHGNPRVSVHGPGYSKILLGDDHVDRWEEYLDIMVDSVFANGGRSCINCSSIFVPRHGKEIADAIAKRLGPVKPLPPTDPNASIAAFTTPAVAEAVHNQIEELLKGSGVTEMTANYRDGSRLELSERYAYLRPTVVYCESPDAPMAKTEYMFPFVSVVECPQDKMLSSIGPTLVCTALTDDPKFRQQLLDAVHIDRLNLGPVKTMSVNWLQPHEGNIVEFLFRNRAFQDAPPPAH